jgi:hypothetical protein
MDEIEITKVQTAPAIKEPSHAYVTLIDLDIQINYFFFIIYRSYEISHGIKRFAYAVYFAS